jgi:hypothetical protein
VIRRRQLVIGIVLAVLSIAALRDVSRLGDALPWRTMDDFPDFYCAGRALDAKASPYTYEPLHACEHRVNTGDTFRARLFQNDPAIAVPAPLPAYDFFPFMALAQLPIEQARLLDAAAILASVALCAAALAGLGIPLEVAVAALLLSTAYAELNTGQIVPFALLALILCGLALARGLDRVAGILAVLTAIEPVVGFPVTVAALAFVPRARWPAIATAGLFALLALAIVGPQALLEYATRVVPAQAASEIHFPFQYSLTYALAHAGLSPGAARAAGTLSYLALFALGLWIAPRASKALGRRELLVFLPALCCVIGGPYVHQEELCLALPALLVLARYAKEPPRSAFAIAVCLLSVPWILVWGYKQLFLASVLICAVILWRLHVRPWPGVASLCAIAALIYALQLHPPHLPVPTPPARQSYAASALVQDEWRVYAEQRSTPDPLWFAIKIPAWTALLTGLVLALRLGVRTSQPNSTRI